MAGPDQWRFNWPYPRPTTFGEVTSDLDHAQERMDRLPVFPPQVFIDSIALTSTTSGSFAVPSGATTFTWYKEEPWTDLLIDIRWGGWITATTGTITDYGVRLDGVDHYCGYFFFNTLAEHHAFSTIRLHSESGYEPIRAGVHTVSIIWRRGAAGAAGTINTDANDQPVICLTECLPPYPDA